MNDGFYEDEDDEQEFEPASPLVNDLRKQLKAKTKAERDKDQRIAALEAKTRNQDLAGILKESGRDPRVAELVPASVDASPEAVGEWLKKFEGVFGSQPQEGATSPAEPDPQVAQQMGAMQQLAQTGQPSGPTSVTQADFQAASSLQEVLDLIAKGSRSS